LLLRRQLRRLRRLVWLLRGRLVLLMLLLLRRRRLA
jgi:hypothetical protein